MKTTVFRSLLLLTAIVTCSGIATAGQKGRDLRADRRDIGKDRRDVRHDRRDLRKDGRDRRNDVRDLRDDKHEPPK